MRDGASERLSTGVGTMTSSNGTSSLTITSYIDFVTCRTSTYDIDEFACGSRSISSVLKPLFATAAERLMAVVVLPTPPFWLATVMIIEPAAIVHARQAIRARCLRSSHGSRLEARQAAAALAEMVRFEQPLHLRGGQVAGEELQLVDVRRAVHHAAGGAVRMMRRHPQRRRAVDRLRAERRVERQHDRAVDVQIGR